MSLSAWSGRSKPLPEGLLAEPGRNGPRRSPDPKLCGAANHIRPLTFPSARRPAATARNAGRGDVRRAAVAHARNAALGQCPKDEESSMRVVQGTIWGSVSDRFKRFETQDPGFAGDSCIARKEPWEINEKAKRKSRGSAGANLISRQDNLCNTRIFAR